MSKTCHPSELKWFAHVVDSGSMKPNKKIMYGILKAIREDPAGFYPDGDAQKFNALFLVNEKYIETKTRIVPVGGDEIHTAVSIPIGAAKDYGKRIRFSRTVRKTPSFSFFAVVENHSGYHWRNRRNHFHRNFPRFRLLVPSTHANAMPAAHSESPKHTWTLWEFRCAIPSVFRFRP